MIPAQSLKKYPHFARFSTAAFDEIVKVAVTKEFKVNDWILREGNKAKDLCLLLSGEIHVAYRLGEGDLAVSDTITPGEAFAWSALIPPHNLTATCIGHKAGEYLAIDAEALRKICAEEPFGAYHLMIEITKTMRDRINGIRVQIVADTPKQMLAEA